MVVAIKMVLGFFKYQILLLSHCYQFVSVKIKVAEM